MAELIKLGPTSLIAKHPAEFDGTISSSNGERKNWPRSLLSRDLKLNARPGYQRMYETKCVPLDLGVGGGGGGTGGGEESCGALQV